MPRRSCDRPGNEVGPFADPIEEIILGADTFGPADVQHLDKPLATKFGQITPSLLVALTITVFLPFFAVKSKLHGRNAKRPRS